MSGPSQQWPIKIPMALFTDVLTKLGLSKEQAEIYESLLNNGPQGAAQLAKTTPVKRTYIYAVVKELIKKGLVLEEKKDTKTIFRGQSPEVLRTEAETQKLKADLALKEIESSLPSLTSYYNLHEHKPIVRTFEGQEGTIKANLEILAEKKDILAYLVINKKIDQQLEKFWKQYYALRVQYNIHVRAITSNTPEGIAYKKRDKEELRETRLVPKEIFPVSIEKNIVGNKVAFFSFYNGTLIATIIENKEIAEAERATFELAWNEAEKHDASISR